MCVGVWVGGERSWSSAARLRRGELVCQRTKTKLEDVAGLVVNLGEEEKITCSLDGDEHDMRRAVVAIGWRGFWVPNVATIVSSFAFKL